MTIDYKLKNKKLYKSKKKLHDRITLW